MITHNASLSYRFSRSDRRLLRGVSIRGGINNVFDAEPSLSDEVLGAQRGAVSPRGRMYSIDITKSF